MAHLANTHRKEWLDTLRGLAIIMVVLVHIIPNKTQEWYIYNVSVSPIMIPMFFAISGYVFNNRKGRQLDFFKNLFFKLIIPSTILVMGARLLLIPKKGLLYFAEEFYQFISGSDNWYITAYIVAETLFFYNLKFSKNTLMVSIIAVACTIIGFQMDHLDICNFAMINRAFIAQLFMLTGYLFRRYETQLTKVRWRMIFGGFLLYLCMTIATFIFWPQQSMDIHLNRYFNPVFCLILIVISCFVLFIAASKSEFSLRWLALIGRHTLTIYLLHTGCIALCNAILPISQYSGIVMLLESIVITIISISVCVLTGIIINRYFPFIMGRFRHK